MSNLERVASNAQDDSLPLGYTAIGGAVTSAGAVNPNYSLVRSLPGSSESGGVSRTQTHTLTVQNEHPRPRLASPKQSVGMLRCLQSVSTRFTFLSLKVNIMLSPFT